MTYYKFTKMPVWQLAEQVVKEVYDLTSKLPRFEDYALRGQLGEAAVSIAGNIAEGFGRGHKKDKISFYLFSRGSAFEVRSHLLTGNKVSYFSPEEIGPINERCLRISNELNKIIKGLSPVLAPSQP